jgi:arginyl-tRNA--protein-N-Asp/Glu arginylyltransferase
MSHPPSAAAPRFYYSAPAPCPYVDGRTERRIFADISGPNAAFSYDLLSEAGFRRSLGFAYRPACPSCRACVAVRIPVREFVLERPWRRVLARNADITIAWRPAKATAEQYELFLRYQRGRHAGGDMASMDRGEYRGMVEVGAIESAIAEFRDPAGRLVAAALVDRMARGFSAVYTFFDPDMATRSLGTLAIVWMVEQARDEGLDHVYLGYWIAESPKMSYKSRFKPLEALTVEGWRPMPSRPTD